MGDREGPNCILGALYYAAENGRWDLARAALAKAAGGPPFKFNDDPGTTFDDIVDLLDKTIKGLE